MGIHIQIGDVTIQRIVEQEAPLFEALPFFPTLTPELLAENRGWLRPKFLDADDKLVLCIQSYVVQTPDHNILIDTCVGNHKPRPTRAFWHLLNSDRYENNLAAAGLTVGDIDFVMCTHLHPDHVGWNTRLEDGRWVPTFPNARYLFADREFDYWTARHKDEAEVLPWITDFAPPDHGRRPRRPRQERARVRRSGDARAHPRPHHRPLFGARRKARRRRADHRRHDPFAAAGPLPRFERAAGLRPQAVRGDATKTVRRDLRHLDARVHGAFPLPVDRAPGEPAGRIRLRRDVRSFTARPGANSEQAMWFVAPPGELALLAAAIVVAGV